MVRIQPEPQDVILQRWARSAVLGDCAGVGAPERTLRQAVQLEYDQTSSQVAALIKQLDRQQQSMENMNRSALGYHEKVMKNLGQ